MLTLRELITGSLRREVRISPRTVAKVIGLKEDPYSMSLVSRLLDSISNMNIGLVKRGRSKRYVLIRESNLWNIVEKGSMMAYYELVKRAITEKARK